MVVATYILKAGKRKSKDILEVLQSIVGRVQDRPGCLKTGIWNNVEHPEYCMLFEMWKSKDDLELFLRSSTYRRMLAVMEMSDVEPEIQFLESNKPCGIEWLQKVLNS